MMAAPPVAPAVKAMLAVPLPGVATNAVGALGTARGVTEMLADTAPSPAAFTARIVTVYCVPFVSPVIIMGLTVVLADV